MFFSSARATLSPQPREHISQSVLATIVFFFLEQQFWMPTFRFWDLTSCWKNCRLSSTCPRRSCTASDSRSASRSKWCRDIWLLTFHNFHNMSHLPHYHNGSNFHILQHGIHPTPTAFSLQHRSLRFNSQKIHHLDQSVNLMFQPPPLWLRRWSKLVSALEAFKKTLYMYMIGAVRLGIMPRSWLQEAVPPMLNNKKKPGECQHQQFKRYGNAHGRYMPNAWSARRNGSGIQAKRSGKISMGQQAPLHSRCHCRLRPQRWQPPRPSPSPKLGPSPRRPRLLQR